MRAEQIVFDEESPTRESGVVACAFARETEVLLARGDDPTHALTLIETTRPLGSSGAEIAADAIVRLVVSCEELEWFPLGPACGALAEASVPSAPLHVVVERTGLSLEEGRPLVAMLVEMGVVVLEAAEDDQ